MVPASEDRWRRNNVYSALPLTSSHTVLGGNEDDKPVEENNSTSALPLTPHPTIDTLSLVCTITTSQSSYAFLEENDTSTPGRNDSNDDSFDSSFLYCDEQAEFDCATTSSSLLEVYTSIDSPRRGSGTSSSSRRNSSNIPRHETSTSAMTSLPSWSSLGKSPRFHPQHLPPPLQSFVSSSNRKEETKRPRGNDDDESSSDCKNDGSAAPEKDQKKETKNPTKTMDKNSNANNNTKRKANLQATTPSSKRRKGGSDTETDNANLSLHSSLNDWQTTFLRFLTSQSDYLSPDTGEPIPLKKLTIWGRQNVKSSSSSVPPNNNTNHLPGDSTTLDSSNNDSPIFVHAASTIPTYAPYHQQGCNFSWVDPTFSTNKAELPPTNSYNNYPEDSAPEAATLHLIRLTVKEAVVFKNIACSFEVGQWLQRERELKVTRQETHPKPPPLFPGIDERMSKFFPLVSHGGPRPERVDLERRFRYMEQSVRFNLLSLCGVDLANIPPEETVFAKHFPHNPPRRTRTRTPRCPVPDLYDQQTLVKKTKVNTDSTNTSTCSEPVFYSV